MVARNPGLRKRPRCAISYVGSDPVSLVGRTHVLGAPGGTGAAHIMQFRPVGIEGPGDELVPESTDSGQGVGAVAPACRGGKGG